MDRAVRGGGTITVAAIGITLLLAPAAEATDRFVDSVMGVNDTSATCTAAPPADGCDFEHAVETVAQPDDDIFLAAGSYSETSEISVGDDGVDLIGPGSPAATLTSSAPIALQLTINAPNSSLSGLRILHTGTNDALILAGSDTSADRVAVAGAGSSACRVAVTPTTVTIRNTVCYSTGNVSGILVDPNASSVVNLRNVTGYTTSSGAQALYVGAQNGADPVVNARNTIFRAVNTALDVYFIRDGDPSSTLNINADFSSYADTTTDADALTTVTPPGSLSNITAAPVFTSADNNFNQAAGSPTIDRGSAAFSSGLDIDDGARIVNSTGLCSATPDIGADEFAMAIAPGPNCVPAAAPVAPQTPKKKKCKKKKRRRGASAAKKKRCKKRRK